MSQMEFTLWNSILTILVGVIGWVMNEKFKALNDVTRLLNRTREEFSRDHVTRAEMRQDMQSILDRFDKLERKIDRILEAEKNARDIC